jgi:hypothetical protein
MTDDTSAPTSGPAPSAGWPRKRLAAALVALLVLVGLAVVFWPRSETFDSPPALLARLDELGAPCRNFRPMIGDWNGLCSGPSAKTYEVSTASGADAYERHVADLLDLDDDEPHAVAVGDGWCVYGDRVYVEKVADLLGGTFHS